MRWYVSRLDCTFAQELKNQRTGDFDGDFDALVSQAILQGQISLVLAQVNFPLYLQNTVAVVAAPYPCLLLFRTPVLWLPPCLPWTMPKRPGHQGRRFLRIQATIPRTPTTLSLTAILTPTTTLSPPAALLLRTTTLSFMVSMMTPLLTTTIRLHIQQTPIPLWDIRSISLSSHILTDLNTGRQWVTVRALPGGLRARYMALIQMCGHRGLASLFRRSFALYLQ